MSRLLLATHNRAKLVELRRTFAATVGAPTDLEVIGLDDVAAYPEPAETEHTFRGNALLKARAAVAAAGLPALADDSGLAVDVLNGMPGVRSARWSGPGATDQRNLDLLIAQLDGVPTAERTARFVCAMALVLPDGTEVVHERTMEGTLIGTPTGTNGFGYDPIFVPTGRTTTSGALSAEDKDAISHRGQAMRAMVATIAELAEQGRL